MVNYTIETFNDKLKEIGLINYVLCGDFKNVLKPTTFYCVIHECNFKARPSDVLTGNTKCYKCSNRLSNYNKNSINEYLNENDRKIILLDEYIDSKTNINFKCSVCDHIWSAKPNNILFGKGCPKCANVLFLSKDIINERLKENNKNIILIGDYNGMKTRTLFNCLDCAYTWMVSPDSLVNSKTGCPCCAKYGFDPSKPAVLYYIKILHHNNIYYKIGISNFGVEKRFLKKDLAKINILFENYYDIGKDAYEKEQEILKTYSNYLYKGTKILSGGNTEILTYDIYDGVY